MKRRLDVVLAERGLFASRTRAAVSVMAGEVCVGQGRRRAVKPGEMIAVDESVSVDARPRFVSRGAIKLENALSEIQLAVEGRRAIDIGASTGGFTDFLLKRGASEVIAVDVGYGELDWQLRNDPRVTVLERTNARYLSPEMLPYAPDLAVIDVSFISLSKVLPAILSTLTDRHDVLALIKPQFEVGRAMVGKGGVVRDADSRRNALVAVAVAAVEMGETVVSFHSSGLPGPKGNRETFVWLVDSPREGADPSREVIDSPSLEDLAKVVEP